MRRSRCPIRCCRTDFGKLKAIIGNCCRRGWSLPRTARPSRAPSPPPCRQASKWSSRALRRPAGTPRRSRNCAEPRRRRRSTAAHAEVGPDTIAKFLFTSGSTGQPKGVINTQLMLCANQAMIRAGLAFLADEPPVIVDWLPWNHTFGSNHNFGLVLDNGGSLYIDEGKPLPGAIDATVRNLRDIAPTIYFNVPKGFEMLLPYLAADAGAARDLFQPAQGDVLCRRGAGAACARRPPGARGQDHRRTHHVHVEPRLDRNRAGGAGLFVGSRARRQYRPAAAGRGAQTRAERR